MRQGVERDRRQGTRAESADSVIRAAGVPNGGRCIMDQAMNGVRRFSLWGLWFGGALILLAAVLIGIDVLMRKFLNQSIGGGGGVFRYSPPVRNPGGARATPIGWGRNPLDPPLLL